MNYTNFSKIFNENNFFPSAPSALPYRDCSEPCASDQDAIASIHSILDDLHRGFGVHEYGSSPAYDGWILGTFREMLDTLSQELDLEREEDEDESCPGCEGKDHDDYLSTEGAGDTIMTDMTYLMEWAEDHQWAKHLIGEALQSSEYKKDDVSYVLACVHQDCLSTVHDRVRTFLLANLD